MNKPNIYFEDSKMFKLQLFVLFLIATLACLSFYTGVNVTYDSNAIIINGERRIIFSGSIHYPRSTEKMWPDLIKKAWMVDSMQLRHTFFGIVMSRNDENMISLEI